MTTPTLKWVIPGIPKHVKFMSVTIRDEILDFPNLGILESQSAYPCPLGVGGFREIPRKSEIPKFQNRNSEGRIPPTAITRQGASDVVLDVGREGRRSISLGRMNAYSPVST